MNRRDFIKSTFLTTLGAVLFTGPVKLIQGAIAKVTTRKYKGLDISLLGFGCMRFPTTSWKKEIDETLTAKMIDYAMRRGVNYYDTAWPYHGGKSEIVIGKILKKYPRNSFYLADKFPVWSLGSKEQVSETFEYQLKKCQVDYFDFYLVHALNKSRFSLSKKFEVYETLKKKKQEGKIKYLGFSFHEDADYLENIITAYEWDFVQLQINPIDWNSDVNSKKIYETATKRKLPVIVMNPLKGGQLSTLNDSAVNILKTANSKVSPSSWSIRYSASLPNVFTVLSGMSSLEQVVDNVNSLTDFKPLTGKEQSVLTNAVAAYNVSGAVSCTYCKYCSDCPIGIDIPEIFAMYNKYKITKNKEEFISQYNRLKEDRRADKCIDCGLCKTKCPQKLDIPELLKEVVKLNA